MIRRQWVSIFEMGIKTWVFLSKHAWEFEPPGSKKLDTYWHKAVSVHRLWLFIPVKKHSSIGPMTLYSLIYRRSEELNFWWGYRGWRWTPGDGGEYRGRGGGSKGSRPLLSWTGQHVSCQRVVKYFKFFTFADVFTLLIWTVIDQHPQAFFVRFEGNSILPKSLKLDFFPLKLDFSDILCKFYIL